MIISEEASSTISKAKIDESKEITPSWNDNGKITYSDHRAFTVEMNNSILDIKYNQKQFMTKEGYRKFNLLLQKEKVSDIWNEDAPTEELYSRWNKAVMDSKKQCMSERRKKDNTSKK